MLSTSFGLIPLANCSREVRSFSTISRLSFVIRGPHAAMTKMRLVKRVQTAIRCTIGAGCEGGAVAARGICEIFHKRCEQVGWSSNIQHRTAQWLTSGSGRCGLYLDGYGQGDMVAMGLEE